MPEERQSLAHLAKNVPPKSNNTPEPEISEEEVKKTATDSGFASHEPKPTIKPRNKYVEPFSVKLRIGMPDLIDDIRTNLKEAEGRKPTLQELQDRLIKAYLKEEGMIDLIVRFDKIVGDV